MLAKPPTWPWATKTTSASLGPRPPVGRARRERGELAIIGHHCFVAWVSTLTPLQVNMEQTSQNQPKPLSCKGKTVFHRPILRFIYVSVPGVRNPCFCFDVPSSIPGGWPRMVLEHSPAHRRPSWPTPTCYPGSSFVRRQGDDKRDQCQPSRPCPTS